jgi:hypothetical protein
VIPLILFLTGCGADGPSRYEVTGTVRYGGQPVAAGRVIFEPDASQGNKGPAGYAEIHQGQYTTADTRGTVGGPHSVRVICLSGESDNSEMPDGRMLCPEYRQQADIPAESSVLDLDVPGSLKW